MPFFFSDDPRVMKANLIKTLYKLAKNPNHGTYHLAYAKSFGTLGDILQNQEEFPGFIRVCYCYGMEFCVVLGKGLFNYDGLLSSEDETYGDVSSGEGPSEEEIYF